MLWRLGFALIWLSTASLAAELEFLSRHRLQFDHRHFGGFSGIEVLEGGNQMLLLTDRGRMFEAGASGRDIAFVGFLGGDSEGLAVADETHWYISFESRYEARGQVEHAWHACYPLHPDFLGLIGNLGLEALAIDPEGRLVALPERRLRGAFPIYRFAPLGWEIAGTLPKDKGFRPVGADFGPDGWLYILERRVGIFGFSNRVRRLRVGSDQAPEVLLRTMPAEFDNLEGISVWQHSASEVRVTLVSDDNFYPFLRNEIVEFRLKN